MVDDVATNVASARSAGWRRCQSTVGHATARIPAPRTVEHLRIAQTQRHAVDATTPERTPWTGWTVRGLHDAQGVGGSNPSRPTPEAQVRSGRPRPAAPP